MDLNNYFAARELVSNIGQPLLFFTLTLSVLTVIFTYHTKLRNYNRHLLVAIFLSLLAGFLLIIWFHYQIYRYLPLINPFNNQIEGRYAIAPWTDNEKLYFWTLLTSIWLVIMRRRGFAFQMCMNAVIIIFLLLTILTSNPFIQPLSSFNEQITGISNALSSQDQGVQYQVLYQAKGMLEGFYNSVYMWIHPPLLFLAYSTFVISFFGSVFMLVNKGDHDYERFAYNWAKPGYIVLTLGLLIGYPWTIQAWKGQPWWFSPKVNITLMMWVLYTAYLHGRLYLNRKGMWNTTAALGILSFTAVVATYISTYILPGIHSVGGQ